MPLSKETKLNQIKESCATRCYVSPWSYHFLEHFLHLNTIQTHLFTYKHEETIDAQLFQNKLHILL